MSPSDLLRETGLKVSTRQFRRYLAGGIIPGVKRGKGGRFVIVGPVTPARIATIKCRLRKFRCAPGRRRLKHVAPVHLKGNKFVNVRFSRLNLAGILIEFVWWMNQCDPIKVWSDEKKCQVLRELIPAAAVARWIANDLNENIPEWDGTKIHLQRLQS